MADIFVYYGDPEDQRVTLVQGTDPNNVEDWTARVADGLKDQCIYFFAEFVDDIDQDWEPTRWWQAVKPDGTVWAQSSDEQEIREAAAEIGVKPQRLFEKVIKDQEWREV